MTADVKRQELPLSSTRQRKKQRGAKATFAGQNGYQKCFYLLSTKVITPMHRIALNTTRLERIESYRLREGPWIEGEIDK